MVTTVSMVNLSSSGSASSASSYVTASVSISANTIVLACVGSDMGASSPNVPTCTGAGRTWTQVQTRLSGGTTRRLTVFRSTGTSPASGALTFDFGGQSQSNGASWSIVEASDVDTSGTNGSNGIVQNATNGVDTTTSLTVTLGAFSNTSNATFGSIFLNGTPGVTPGSGFTELAEGTGSRTVQTEWKTTNDTTVDWSWTGNHDSAGIALEVKFSAGTGQGFFAIL